MYKIGVNKDGVINISGNVTIVNLESIYQEMTKIYNNEIQCSAIDMSGVDEIDTAGLQMLMSFVKSFQEIGTEIKCTANPKVKEFMALTGLENRFHVA
jgi:anti-anti-sigma factor